MEWLVVRWAAASGELFKTKPLQKPRRPYFSSGPCVKPPGWASECLDRALFSRSHRSAAALEKFKELSGAFRRLLEIPQDYLIALVPGSTTGAMEMALWSLLGPQGWKSGPGIFLGACGLTTFWSS